MLAFPIKRGDSLASITKCPVSYYLNDPSKYNELMFLSLVLETRAIAHHFFTC